MQNIEQAIFTSAETDRGSGYQVVAASPRVLDVDRRELAVWGPSHDALLDSGADSVSLNFFHLPSGAFCVSRTTPAGWEYSRQGGHRVYTHCLVVPPEVLQRFANHPIALARAAVAAGAMEPLREIPSRLYPLDLPGAAPAVDAKSLVCLARQVGPRQMATLVQAMLEGSHLAVDGPVPVEPLLAGLLDCLPPECRTMLTFSTGLRHSCRRPFRIVPLPRDPAARRCLANQANVVVMDLCEQQTAESVIVDDWARFIQRVLASDRVEFLAAELSQPRTDFMLDDLPSLGLQLIEDFDASEFHELCEGVDCGVPTRGARRAHAAHQRFEKTVKAATATLQPIAIPSESLNPDSPEVLERLEALDDVVFDGINGRAEAIETLRSLWPNLRAELGDRLLAESREHYLRYALSVWQRCTDLDETSDPALAVHALDVLCVLFDEV